MDLEIATAFVLLPILMIMAAQGWMWLICVFIMIVVGSYIYNYLIKPKVRKRFFLGWAIISFFFVLAVFELEVVPYLEILFIENFILMCFVACMCLCIFYTKSSLASAPVYNGNIVKMDSSKKARCEVCSTLQPLRTYHCDICGICIHRRDHHSIWLDTCIGSKNLKLYVGALFMLLVSAIYSSNLTLTTICHPTLVGGLFLMPDDCSDVFGDIHIGICFVSAVYTLMIAVVGFYLLSSTLYLICYNTSYHEYTLGEMGTHSNGILKNMKDFWNGYA